MATRPRVSIIPRASPILTPDFRSVYAADLQRFFHDRQQLLPRDLDFFLGVRQVFRRQRLTRLESIPRRHPVALGRLEQFLNLDTRQRLRPTGLPGNESAVSVVVCP